MIIYFLHFISIYIVVTLFSYNFHTTLIIFVLSAILVVIIATKCFTHASSNPLFQICVYWFYLF